MKQVLTQQAKYHCLDTCQQSIPWQAQQTSQQFVKINGQAMLVEGDMVVLQQPCKRIPVLVPCMLNPIMDKGLSEFVFINGKAVFTEETTGKTDKGRSLELLEASQPALVKVSG